MAITVAVVLARRRQHVSAPTGRLALVSNAYQYEFESGENIDEDILGPWTQLPASSAEDRARDIALLAQMGKGATPAFKVNL